MGNGIARNEYQRAIGDLFARTGTTAKLGLERTNALLDRLDRPERRYATFHVAGTNGKGSVVAMLYALLRAKGLSVGRYTSPHLVDFRERIVVDDEQIGEDEVLSFLRAWEQEADRLGATFFELTTVLAFQHFARRKVDVAVIETGMGGRLDATNVIAPVVTAVTSVGLDHTEHLGATLVEIAREKAGIFKPGIPAVLGPVAGEAGSELRRVAAEVDAPVIDASERYPVRKVELNADGTDVDFATGSGSQRVRVGLVGRVQAHNAAVAMTSLNAGGPGYRTGLDEAAAVLSGLSIPGRFQRIGKFVFDVAHNVEGMRELRATLESVALPRPLTVVVAIMRDKPWTDMLRVLVPIADSIVITQSLGAPAERRWEPAAVAREVSGLGARVTVKPDLIEALTTATEGSGTVLVTGSFYSVGDALRELGSIRGFQ